MSSVVFTLEINIGKCCGIKFLIFLLIVNFCVKCVGNYYILYFANGFIEKVSLQCFDKWEFPCCCKFEFSHHNYTLFYQYELFCVCNIEFIIFKNIFLYDFKVRIIRNTGCTQWCSYMSLE